VIDSLWIGQKGAMITIIPLYNINGTEYPTVVDWMASEKCHIAELNHFEPSDDMADTTLLATDSKHHNVWSYVYPGMC